MMRAVRRFRRVPIAREAALETSMPASDRRVPVMIRSITCEGAGIALGRATSWIQPGSQVELRFQVDGSAVNVPGRIAWYDPSAADKAPFHAGIRFRLDAARADHSRRYADWIVDLISRVTRDELELGALLVRVAGLPLATLQEAIDRQKDSGRGLTDVLLSMRVVSEYDLRLASRCRLPVREHVVPMGLLEWRERLLARHHAH
jgi:hypothetical protein